MNHVLGALIFVSYNNYGGEVVEKESDVGLSVFVLRSSLCCLGFLSFRLPCEYKQRA